MGTINPQLFIFDSNLAGVENLGITPFSYTMPAKTLASASDNYTQSQTFSLPSGFNLQYMQMQLPAYFSPWLILNSGFYILDTNLPPGFTAPTATNSTATSKIAFRISTTLNGSQLTQSFQYFFEVSGTPPYPSVTVSSFTVNLKVFTLKAPF